MNYEKIYNNIIEKSKFKLYDSYSEVHHIIPKCCGGTNKKSNLVRVSYREHFLLHWLLTKIYPDNQKLKASFAKMLETTKTKERIISSWMFEAVKRSLRGRHFEWLKGKEPWNKNKKGLQQAWNKGISLGSMSNDSKKKISNTLKEFWANNVHPRKNKNPWNKGKTGLQKAWNKGISPPEFTCIYCNKPVKGLSNLNRWHNENCKKK